MAALKDAGVTMDDMGVLAVGNLMGGQAVRPGPAEADRPDRHPRLQRGQRLRDRGYRPAGGRSCRSRPARPTTAWPSGSRSWPAPGSWPRATSGQAKERGRREAGSARWRRSTAGSARRRCRACSPRSAWSTATSTAGRSFELFARISEKNHAHSTLNPKATYQKRFTLERDHERRHDRLPQHPADVLGQLRRRGRGRGGQRRRSSRPSPPSSGGGRSRSRPRCSRPTRGRRPARSCPTSTP